MIRKKYKGVLIQLIHGDISNQTDIKAVVNAANVALRPGSGVAGAIHRVAGSGLYEECKALAPIKTGQAVITEGHNLANSYVIHCVGPVYGVDKSEDKLLADCYQNALFLAEQYQIDSIAFPAISTGVFGYPIPKAAIIAFEALKRAIPALNYVRIIRIVLYDKESYRIHEEIFKHILNCC